MQVKGLEQVWLLNSLEPVNSWRKSEVTPPPTGHQNITAPFQASFIEFSVSLSQAYGGKKEEFRQEAKCESQPIANIWLLG